MSLLAHQGLRLAVGGGGGMTQSITFVTDTPEDWSITSGNQTAQNIDTGTTLWRKVRCASPKSTGKHYFEIKLQNLPGVVSAAIGVAPAGTSSISAEGGVSNAGNGGRIQYFNDGRKRQNGSYETYGTSFGSGDVIGIAYDADAGTLIAYLNGASQGSMYTGVGTDLEPHLCFYGGNPSFPEFKIEGATILPAGYSIWTP